jgi:TPR repeat protein
MNARDVLFAFIGFNVAVLAALLVLVYQYSKPGDEAAKVQIAAMQKQLEAELKRAAAEQAARQQAAEEATRRALAEARAKAEAETKRQAAIAEAEAKKAQERALAAARAAEEAVARAENERKRYQAPRLVAPPGTTAEMLFQQAEALEREGKGSEAVRIYLRAARSGSGKAAKRLGEIYDKGIPGVSRDYAESLKWYNTARALGEDVRIDRRSGADADKALAEARAKAEAAQARIAAAEAAAQERIAAAEAARRQGDSGALGPVQVLIEQANQLELEGKGPEAVRIYTLAVRRGSGPAARRLWVIYDNGIPGVPRDYAEALKWLHVARALGEDIKDIRRENSPAMQEILRRSATEDFYVQAVMLEKEGRFADAARYYRLAARTGNGKAALRLGEIYGKGMPGVEMNYGESLKWLNTARVLGEEPAPAR